MSPAATGLASAASSQAPTGMTPEAANKLHIHKTAMTTNESCSCCKEQGETSQRSAVVFKLKLQTTQQQGQAAIHGRWENGPDTFQQWCKIMASRIQQCLEAYMSNSFSHPQKKFFSQVCKSVSLHLWKIRNYGKFQSKIFRVQILGRSQVSLYVPLPGYCLTLLMEWAVTGIMQQ